MRPPRSIPSLPTDDPFKELLVRVHEDWKAKDATGPVFYRCPRCNYTHDQPEHQMVPLVPNGRTRLLYAMLRSETWEMVIHILLVMVAVFVFLLGMDALSQWTR